MKFDPYQPERRKIAVIVPVYNQEELIVRALDSIPTSRDISVIIVEDGSTDNTYDVIVDYIERRGWITNRDVTLAGILEEGETVNQGVAAAVNLGLDFCDSDYVVLLGSDDYFLPGAFEKIMPYLDGTDLVYFGLELNSGEIWNVSEGNKRDLCGSVKFMKRSFIGDTRCPEDKKWAEDLDFYQQLLAKNPTENFTGLTLKHYNFPREGSLTQQMLQEKEKNGEKE